MPTKLKLTEKGILHAKPADKGSRYTLLDLVVPGLALRVTDKAAKSWVVQGRIKGGAGGIRVMIGSYPAIELADAREKARAIVELMARGQDPRVAVERERIQEKRRQADTFEAVARDFIAKHLSKNRTGERDRKLIERDLIPAWGVLPMTDIRRRDVADLLDKVATRQKGKPTRGGKDGRKIGGPVAANRRMSTIRKIFNWALSRGIVEANPAARMERIGEEKPRDRVLADHELRLIWQAAAELGAPFGCALQLLMITGQRRTEVGRMRDALVDRDKAAWTVPAEDAKNKREHLVPLSREALAVVAALDLARKAMAEAGQEEPKRLGDFLVTSNGSAPISGWSKYKLQLDRKLAELVAEAGPEAKGVEPWTLHDIRRTVATGMARIGIDQFTVGKVLNHTDRSVTGVHYNKWAYEPEKRAALDRWAGHLRLVVDPPANVVRLQAVS